MNLRNFDWVLWFAVISAFFVLATWWTFGMLDSFLTQSALIEAGIITSILYGLYKLNRWWYRKLGEDSPMKSIYLLMVLVLGAAGALGILGAAGLVPDLLLKVGALALGVAGIALAKRFLRKGAVGEN